MTNAVYDNPMNHYREYWVDRRLIRVIAEVALTFAMSESSRESIKEYGEFEPQKLNGDAIAVKGFEVCLACDTLAHIVLYSEEVPELDSIPLGCCRCLHCESIYANDEITLINDNIKHWYYTDPMIEDLFGFGEIGEDEDDDD